MSPYNTDPQRFNYLNHLTAKVPGTYVNYFNTITTEDAGKWLYQELGNTQPAAPAMNYIDEILSFANVNKMDVRMHALMWDFRPQQPGWVSSLIDKAYKGDQVARQTLTNAILNRIDYMVHDRASGYQELDGLNEALLTGKLWSIYGGAGVAYFYNEAMRAAADAGNSNLRIFTNEYKVFQDGDSYANWYINKEIKPIRDQGGQLGGIGMQYYVSKHSPSRMMQVLQNMSGQDLPLVLTEFGVQKGKSARKPPRTWMIHYGCCSARRSHRLHPVGFLERAHLAGGPQRRPVGCQLEPDPRRPGLDPTDATVEHHARRPDRRRKWLSELSGFYGDYDVIIGDQHFDLSLVKGISDYVLNYVDPNLPIFDPSMLVTGLMAVLPENTGGGDPPVFNMVTVPEPSSLVLGVVAAASLMFWGHRQNLRRCLIA